MKNIAYTTEMRGHERSALISLGREIVAEVFTASEPGDQYQTARLFAAAPAMLAALERVQALLAKGTHLGGTAEDFHQYRQLCTAVNDAIRAATA